MKSKNALILDIIEFMEDYDPYGYRDSFTSYRDAFTFVEECISTKDRTQEMIQNFETLTEDEDFLEEFTEDADLIIDRLYEHLYTDFAPDIKAMITQGLLISLSIIVMMILVFSTFIGAVIQTSERISPDSVTSSENMH